MTPFYGWGSTGMRLQSHYEVTIYFYTIKSPEIPVTYLIDLRRMKGWVDLGATQWFRIWDPWIGNQAH